MTLAAIGIFILGATIGGIDIAMNAHALEVERAYERPIFSSFHAMWSIGGVLGSAIAAICGHSRLATGFQMAVTMVCLGCG